MDVKFYRDDFGMVLNARKNHRDFHMDETSLNGFIKVARESVISPGRPVHLTKPDH